MGTTYQRLLEEYVRIRDAEYSSDPERDKAFMEVIGYCLQTMLEKLSRGDKT